MPVAAKIRLEAESQELPAPAYVVLGMLRLGARSGYQIKQAVQLSIRFFWTISEAQIYPSLKRLEASGFVHGRSEPKGRLPRRIYEITDAGRTELEAWLRREEPMPSELRDIGMVKLFFADALPRDDAIALLTAIRRRSEERVATLRAIEPAAKSVEEEGNAHPLLTLRIGIAFHEAMIDVCDEFAKKFSV